MRTENGLQTNVKGSFYRYDSTDFSPQVNKTEQPPLVGEF
jgi:hypothetical protein